jgi:hypothetical protein
VTKGICRSADRRIALKSGENRAQKIPRIVEHNTDLLNLKAIGGARCNRLNQIKVAS